MSLKGKSACLWHAYYSLGEQSGKNMAMKGQLKVLTHNLATSFDMMDVEKKLQDSFDADTITFPEYLAFLKRELFEPLIAADRLNESVILSLDRIDQVCWFICSKSYTKRLAGVLGDDDVSRLWRVFNSVAETDDADESVYPVVVDADELELLVRRINMALAREDEKVDLRRTIGDMRHVDFGLFLGVVESQCFAGKGSAAAAGTVVAGLFDEMVVEVVKKGYLQRKGQGVTGGWKDHWCVLSLSRFCLFSNRDEKEMKADIIISVLCKLEDITEKSGKTIGLGSKPHRFVVRSDPNKVLEVSAPDAQTKTEWMTALQSAIDWSVRGSTPKRLAFKKRKTERAEQRAEEEKAREEKRKQNEEMTKTRQQLDAEKRARADAEERIREEESKRLEEQGQMQRTQELLEAEKQARAEAELLYQEEAHQRELEQQRLRELEELQKELEKLLEAERQAKRDEEIVRAIQSRILQEEFEHREQLERTKQELEALLQEEQLRNLSLEEERRQQTQFLEEEQRKLENLQTEKLRHEQELQAAIVKLQEAEKAKFKMEEEFKRKESEQKRLAKFSQSNVMLPTGSHRGEGAFSSQDFVKKTNLTPITPDSPFFAENKICRTPISPPVQTSFLLADDSDASAPPPIPPKRGKSSTGDAESTSVN